MIHIKTLSDCRNTVGYKMLNKRARGIYDSLCTQLLDSGEVPVVFLDQIAMYAHSYAEFIALDKQVQKEGRTLISKDKRGDDRVYPNPAVKLRREALEAVLKIGKNFGFSKLDVTRIPGSDISEDKFEAFMRSMNDED